MINHHIDRAISLIELHQNYIDLYEDIIEWDAETDFNVEFSEDEIEYNTNVRKNERMDDSFLAYCNKELKHHRHELERAKVRLRVSVLTFNEGWTF